MKDKYFLARKDKYFSRKSPMGRFSCGGSDVVQSARLDVELTYEYSGIMQWGVSLHETEFLNCSSTLQASILFWQKKIE